MATPYTVLEVASPEQVGREIARVVRQEGVQRLVVGVPLNMDGTLGRQANLTIDWARRLSEELRLKLVLVDERLSSFQAEQQLVQRKRQGEKLTRQRKKRQLDALAAAGFLQAFLDGQLHPLEP